MIGDLRVDELALQIREGSARALSRGLTWVEAGGERAEALVDALFPHTGRAHIVGVTGPPGGGKSTLVRALTRIARARGVVVGVVAIDPSSPFSGGSILGDRIRMNDLTLDPGVFIRSMATRGALGGLCRGAADAADLMDAAGKGLVILETVGVGQDEVDVVRLAHTIVVVSVPGLGDDIQALKAGLFEIADVHVVNKGDHAGAEQMMAELRTMLAMAPHGPGGRVPPILPCVAIREEGVSAVVDVLWKHAEYLKVSGELLRRQRRIVEARVLKYAQELVASSLAGPADGEQDLGALMERVARRELSPRACARVLLAHASDRERTAHV